MQAVLCGIHPLVQRLAGVFCSALKQMPTILANYRFFSFRDQKAVQGRAVVWAEASDERPAPPLEAGEPTEPVRTRSTKLEQAEEKFGGLFWLNS